MHSQFEVCSQHKGRIALYCYQELDRWSIIQMSSRSGDSVTTDCVKVAVRGKWLLDVVYTQVRPLVARERGLADIAVVADSSRNEVGNLLYMGDATDFNKGQ